MHHLFSPSAAHRWMVCAPERQATAGIESAPSFDAVTGTIAHELAATCLQVGCDAREAWQSVEVVSRDGFEIVIDDDMRDNVQKYLDYVRSFNGGMEVEVRMVHPTDSTFGGTGDVLIWDLATQTLHVIDLKFGKGVRVMAKGNKQMLSYALLAILRNDGAFEIERVQMHVAQPRLGHYDSDSVTVEELWEFAAEVGAAMERARHWFKKSAVPKPTDFTPGEHCRFCAVRGTCTALANHAVVSAQAIFADVTEVPTPTLGAILTQADMIDAWIAAVRKEAMDRALKGEPIDGFKLVPKRATRSWVDAKQVEAAALDNVLDVYAPREVASPAALEKRLGKEVVASLFAPLIQSVSSGLTLVAASDKRPAVDPATAAADKAAAVFSDVTGD